MSPRKAVLVVGTTPDYVDLIRKRWPGRAIFLTDKYLRMEAQEEAPEEWEEVLSDLGDGDTVVSDLKSHLADHNIALSGVACYDCESLELASDIAKNFGLPFHDSGAIGRSRSKYESKRIWEEAGILCPLFALARSENDLDKALAKTGLPAVLKPLTGAGSELVFRCETREEALKALAFTLEKLSSHRDPRMYPPGGEISSRECVIVEECIESPEFSCEFLLEKGEAKIFRISGKVRELADGTAPRTIAYIVPGLDLRAGAGIGKAMGLAAASLGFESGIFMADFFVREGEPVILELTPRPSGDCIPHLVRIASGFDTIGAALDLAEGKEITVPTEADYKEMAGLRLLADRKGVVKSINAEKIVARPRVREVYIRRSPGHQVDLPPEDYDSFVLGHVIFEPDPSSPLEEECAGITALLEVEYEV